jgi:hypothetical protein
LPEENFFQSFLNLKTTNEILINYSSKPFDAFVLHIKRIG